MNGDLKQQAKEVFTKVYLENGGQPCWVDVDFWLWWEVRSPSVCAKVNKGMENSKVMQRCQCPCQYCMSKFKQGREGAER